jgi:hypothetical protein
MACRLPWNGSGITTGTRSFLRTPTRISTQGGPRISALWCSADVSRRRA